MEICRVLASERQAIVSAPTGKVIEVFRNPVNAAGLEKFGRFGGRKQPHLQLPTGLFLTGKVLCAAQGDHGVRDNSSRRPGEINASEPADGPIPVGKISCMDQELKIPGLRLPID